MNEEKLPHGGDWAGFEIEYGEEPLDFSMNVNPLGISPAVAKAIAEAAACADRYPDPHCRQLRRRLAETEGVDASRIYCGSGAADIIYRLAYSLRQERCRGDGSQVVYPAKAPVLLVTAPTFSEYEMAFRSAGWEIRHVMLTEDTGFRIEGRALQNLRDQIEGGVQAVFLCEPNNPTGVVTDRRILRNILSWCRASEAWLILDECFGGFLDAPQAHTMADLLQGAGGPAVDDADRLILLKAFTKLHGMAGVRLGYCLCPQADLPRRLQQAGPPWNVSSLAQAAGLAALDDGEHVTAGREIISRERGRLATQIARILGKQAGIDPASVKVYGQANYVLFRLPGARVTGTQNQVPGARTPAPLDPGIRRSVLEDVRGNAARIPLHDLLARQGILVRDCSDYLGLGEGWYRVAVRRPEENDRLIAALEKAFGIQREEDRSL